MFAHDILAEINGEVDTTTIQVSPTLEGFSISPMTAAAPLSKVGNSTGKPVGITRPTRTPVGLPAK